jgi:hypothetical protein
MIERTLYGDRFYLVLWKTKRGPGRTGHWNFIIKDTETDTGFTGSEPGTSKSSFDRARAAAVRWAMYRYNLRNPQLGELPAWVG